MIIGTRVLQAKISGKMIDVPVRLYLPTYADRRWTCVFTIDWPDGRDTSHASGGDALQAIHLALRTVAVLLYASPLHKAGALSWGGEAGYGFPLHPSAKDLAVGMDKSL